MNLHPVFEAALRGCAPPELPTLAVERESMRFLLNAIGAAYDRALLDPAARIPTYLHAAIEAARK